MNMDPFYKPWSTLALIPMIVFAGVCFIFPALIMQLYAKRCLKGIDGLLVRAIAAILIFAGIGIMGNGVVPLISALISALSNHLHQT